MVSDKNRAFHGIYLGLAYILIKLPAGDYCAAHKPILISLHYPSVLGYLEYDAIG